MVLSWVKHVKEVVADSSKSKARKDVRTSQQVETTQSVVISTYSPAPTETVASVVIPTTA